MAQKVRLKKSAVVDRTPQANSLDFGELTINYASGSGKSFLAHKKYDGSIAKYHEDSYNESKFATKSELGGIQSSLDNFATKEMLNTASGNAVTSAYTMAKDYIDSAISGISIGDYLTVASANSVFTGYTERITNIESQLGNYALSATVKTELSAITKTIEEDEYVIAQAFNEHNDRISDLEDVVYDLGGEFLTIESATSIVSDLGNQVGTAISKAESAFNYTEAVSATVKATYWDSATTKSKIEAASANAYNLATAFTDNNFVDFDTYNTYTGNVSNDISKIATSAQSAYTYAKAIDTNLTNNYWNTGDTQSKINAASANAYNQATAYTHDNYISAGTYNEYTGNVSNSLSKLSESINYVSGVTSGMSANVVTYINNKLSSVYIYKGTVQNYASLPNSGKVTGYVYNVVDANGNIPAGTNYAWNGDAWDALGGSVDLSGYATTGRVSDVESELTKYASLSSWTVTNAATHTEVGSASSNSYTQAVASAKSYTDSRLNATSGSFVTNAAFGSYSSATENKINNVNNALTAFSATVISDYATDADASSYAAAALGNAKAYTDSKISDIGIGDYLTVTSATSIVNALNLADDNTMKAVNALSGTVSGTYATKVFVGNASGYSYNKAKTDLIGASTDASTADTIWGAKNYAKAISGSIETKIGGVESSISNVNTALTAFSSTVVTNYATKTDASNYAVSAYTSAKTYTDSKISELSIGNYLTVASASQIVTDLSLVDDNLDKKINAVSGTVSGTYATKAFVGAASGYSLSKAKTDLIGASTDAATADTIWGAKNYAKQISGNITTAIGGIESKFSDYYTTAQTNTQIGNASARSVNSAVSYTNTQISNASARTFASAKTYVDNTFLTIDSATSKFTSIDNNINNVNTALTAFSATVISDYATDAEASEYAAAALGNAMAYTDSKIMDIAIGDYLTVSSANSIVTTLNLADDNLSKAINAVSATVSGTYATKAYADAESAAAVTAVVGNSSSTSASSTITGSKKYTDEKVRQLSGNVLTKIGEVESTVSTLQLSAQTLNNKFTAYTTTTDLQNTYATKTFVGSASGYAYDQATAYTKTVSGNIETEINAVKSDVSTNSDNIEALSASVINNYATNARASSYAAAALSNSMDYTDSKIAGLSIGDYLTVTSADSIVTSLGNSINAEHNLITGVSGTVIALSGSVVDKLSNVYKYMGSVDNYASLPNSGKTNGYVYNVIAANGNPGEAGYTPAGTNYAWNGTAWDPLGGTVDLTGYITSASVVGIETSLKSSINNAATSAQSAYTYAQTVDTNLKNGYWNSATTQTKIHASTTSAATSAVTYANDTFFTKASAGTMYDDITNMIEGLTDFALSATVKSEIEEINSTMEEAQEVTAAALTDLNTRVNQFSNSIGNYLSVASAETIVTTLNSNVNDAVNIANSAYNYTDAVSGTVVEGYWDSSTTLSKINVASGVAYNSAVSYTNLVSGNIATAITSINSNLTNYVAKTGDTMTGNLNFGTQANASNADGIRWGTDKAGIGGSNNGALGIYANGGIYIRPSAYFDNVGSYGLVITSADVKYNTNVVYHAGNASGSLVTLGGEQTITGVKTFSNGFKVNYPTTSFGSGWRSIPFSQTGDSNTSIIRYYNTNASTGLSFDAKYGWLRAGGFFINGKSTTDLLNASGGVTTVASITGNCVPTTRKVNGHALSADVTVTAGDVGLGDVENTKLSTWTGNTSIKSVGTVTAGTWNATPIAATYLASSAITINGTPVGLGGSATIDATDKNVGQASSTADERRALVLGTTTAATGTALSTTSVTGETAFNKDIYAVPSTGQLNAKQVRVDEHVTLQYNSGTQALDFIFS